MSSAVCFNLDQSKILSSGNGLTLYQTTKMQTWFSMKGSADDKTYVTEKLKLGLGRVENIMGKGENAGYQQNVFKMLFLQDCVVKG